jgi:hypothetical protein
LGTFYFDGELAIGDFKQKGYNVECLINGEQIMRIGQTLLISLVLCCGFQMALADEIDSQLIIVESSPANLFEKGQILAGEESIKLATGQRVKLIASDGTVFTLIGNDSGVPTRHIDNSENALVQALKLLSDSRYHIFRGGEEPPNVWMANIDVRGNYCALGNTITLWRSKAQKATTLVIESRKPRGEAKKIKWAAKDDTYTFAFQSGTKYRIYLTNRPRKKNTLTFYQIPADIQLVAQKVRWMAKKKCIQQAKRCFPNNKSECE